jgi:hypothetical protein
VRELLICDNKLENYGKVKSVSLVGLVSSMHLNLHKWQESGEKAAYMVPPWGSQ